MIKPDLLEQFISRSLAAGSEADDFRTSRSDYFLAAFERGRDRLRNLLEVEPSEHELQAVLEEEPVLLLSAMNDGFYPVHSLRSVLFAKVDLGREHQTDFAYCVGSSYGMAWTFVELERSNGPLFTKAGDPSAGLTHAIRQVTDWASWVSDNSHYACELLQKLIKHSPMEWHWPRLLWRPPRAVVVMGRRSMLTEESNRRRAQLCVHNPSLEIITYDRLCDPYGAYAKGDPSQDFGTSQVASEPM